MLTKEKKLYINFHLVTEGYTCMCVNSRKNKSKARWSSNQKCHHPIVNKPERKNWRLHLLLECAPKFYTFLNNIRSSAFTLLCLSITSKRASCTLWSPGDQEAFWLHWATLWPLQASICQSKPPWATSRVGSWPSREMECVCREQWMLTVAPPPILSLFFQHQKHSGKPFGRKRSSCLARTRQSFRGDLSKQGWRGLEACCKLQEMNVSFKAIILWCLDVLYTTNSKGLPTDFVF